MGFPPKVTRKPLAPRLDTLDGKTVYLVDCRFDDSDIFLKQMQAWFAEHMPGVKTRLQADQQRLHQGRPGHLGGDQGERRRRHHRRRPLKHLCAGGRRARDDASTASTGCPPSPCTPTCSTRGHASVARVNGMPGMRQVFVPQPIMGKTRGRAARLHRRQRPDHRPAGHAGGRRGADRGRSTDEDAADVDVRALDAAAVSSRTPRTNLHQLFLENNWTDKLPIVLPTEERVAAMLRAHQPRAGRGRRAHARRRTSASTGSTRSRRSRSTRSWPARGRSTSR